VAMTRSSEYDTRDSGPAVVTPRFVRFAGRIDRLALPVS
jgi:hypothetical protein